MAQTEKQKRLQTFFANYFDNFGKIFTVNILISLPFLIFGGIITLISYFIGVINIFICFLLIPLMSPFFAGITYICKKVTLNQPFRPVKDFVKGIKDNWKYFLINSFILYAIMSGLWLTFSFYRNNLSNPAIIAAFVFSVIFTVYFMFMEFLIPVMTVSVELKFVEILKNSVVLALAGFINNLKTIISIMLVISVIFTIFQLTNNIIAGLIITGILFITLLPTFCVYIVTFNSYQTVEKYVITPYAEAHISEKVKKEKEEAVSEIDMNELAELANGNPDEYVFVNGRMIKRSAIQKILDKNKH